MDYWCEVELSRDKVATLIGDNEEQAPYVFAEAAGSFQPGTYAYDSFIDGLAALEQSQRDQLLAFCAGVADRLKPAKEDAA